MLTVRIDGEIYWSLERMRSKRLPITHQTRDAEYIWILFGSYRRSGEERICVFVRVGWQFRETVY